MAVSGQAFQKRAGGCDRMGRRPQGCPVGRRSTKAGIRSAEQKDNNNDEGQEAEASANVIDIGQNGRAEDVHGNLFQF